ncbi:hypothetical protein HFN_2384 [Helicobacter fennelliae MRY12-0050]|uniref:Uncharacterized protein n=1 Tax=Helicobacter fennelliae MRY12-0050 TaxID=1325130 RepID=T1CZV1_9HELI|nr:hypothetical protein HFN_2384 [Helicobacter fennelliae MRY12-0050]
MRDFARSRGNPEKLESSKKSSLRAKSKVLRGNLESTDSIVFLFLIILCMESLAFASE